MLGEMEKQRQNGGKIEGLTGLSLGRGLELVWNWFGTGREVL